MINVAMRRHLVSDFAERKRDTSRARYAEGLVVRISLHGSPPVASVGAHAT
jgi:hypothetical protein